MHKCPSRHPPLPLVHPVRPPAQEFLPTLCLCKNTIIKYHLCSVDFPSASRPLSLHMAPKKFPNLELHMPSKMQAWLNAKGTNFANVGLGRFYTDEWRFVHAPFVQEWLENLPATGYTSNVRGRSVTLNRASLDRIFGFPDVLPDTRRRNPNSDKNRTLIGIIAGPDAEYREKQGYTMSKFNTEINKIHVKGILQILLMLKKWMQHPCS